ncbi:site-specific integrase [Pseudomonas serbica]
MINFSIKLLGYLCLKTNLPVEHCIIFYNNSGRTTLLSHINLFLYNKTRSSQATSFRYAYVIAAFYNYLSRQPAYKNRNPGQYHIFVSNNDIELWQVARQIERDRSFSIKPSTETIVNDSDIILTFFAWLAKSDVPTQVKIDYKTKNANFKDDRLLQYISVKARGTIDSSNIRVLDKTNRQQRINSLITDSEIKQFLEGYSDPVYAVIFNLALGTAMRPMDLAKFPYLGNADNTHIMPYSQMDQGSKFIEYTVYRSKRKKDRTIEIHLDDLLALEENYIKTMYKDRAEKFEKLYKKKCPPSILFLNQFGRPITAKMISKQSNAAKNNAIIANPTFRESLNFYQTRHWWPTQYMIRFFGEKLLDTDSEVLNMAVAQTVANQLGHNSPRTTFKHYINIARVVMAAYKGQVKELVKASNGNTAEMLKQLDAA